MTLETFNLLLAIGGGVAVPSGVGLFAAWRVHQQEKVRFAHDAALTSGNTRTDGTSEVADDDRVLV